MTGRRERGRSRGREQGTALVEVFYLAVVLMVPLVYLMLSVFAVQRAAYAVTQAARETGRVFTVTGDSDAARAAGELALADHDVPVSRTSMTICGGAPAACYVPGGRVEVVVRTEVPLPFVPEFLAGAVNTVIPVTGRHVATVDELRQL